MQTADTGLLFQTNQQLDAAAQRKLKIAASQDIGNPITVSSKILDVQVIWPNAWTAESGWLARHLDLEVCHYSTTRLGVKAILMVDWRNEEGV